MPNTDNNGTPGGRRTGRPSTQHFIDYESGLMSDEEIIAFFQSLIDSGMAWGLQGHYGRMATYLIKAGTCKPPQEESNG